MVLGVLAAAGMSAELPRLLPLALIVIGACSLVGSVASYLCIPHARRAERAEPKVPTPFASDEASNPASDAIRENHAHARLETRPHSGIGRATFAELNHIEDELWRRWASPRSAPLGAALTGPVPETAYSPTRSGAYAPFADRDRDILMLTDARTAGAGTPSSESDARAHSPRPGMAKRSAIARPSPAPRADIVIRPKETRAASETPGARGFAGMASPLLSGRPGDLFDMDALDHPAYLATINPKLPRLGAAGGAEGRTGSARPVSSSRLVSRGGVCHECSRRLLDFRAWVECRVCRKPLCRECLQESFSTAEGGSCLECREERAWSAGRDGSNPRNKGSAVGWVHA